MASPLLPPTISARLDSFLRHLDLRTRRTSGGWLEARLGIDRHTPAALLLPATLCGLLILASPTWPRAVLATFGGIAVCVVVAFQLRRATKRHSRIGWDFLAQVGACGVLGAAIWFKSSSRYSDVWPYRHLLIPLTAATIVALLAGMGLLRTLFGPLETGSGYGGYLKRTELFASLGTAPTSSPFERLVSAIAVAVRAPLAFLTVPALAVLMAPPAWVHHVLIGAIAFALVTILLAGASDRFGEMWILLQQDLIKGGALITSLAAVTLAAARIADVTYVTTLFNSAAWWMISVCFAEAYVLSWWFDYWFHRMLTDAILRLLAPNTHGVAAIPYPIYPCAVSTSVPGHDRWLQIHGSGRFLAIQASNPVAPYFQAMRPIRLIQLLADSGAPGGKATPTPSQIASRIANYQALTALVFVAIVSGYAWFTHEGVQDPEATAQAGDAGAVQLSQLIAQRAKDAGDEPLFVIAASGGGTRAAVYTAAILEAMAAQAKADRIVLGSGVSGGGAALAYFASKRNELIAEHSDAAWQRYFDVMKQPFIRDVLERSTEWYMAEEGRLGTLLADSFETRWKLTSRKTLTDIDDMGLILNTSLAGYFECPKVNCAGQLEVIEQRYRDQSRSDLAGGRLLLTNLKDTNTWTSKALEPGAKALPVIVRGSKMRLEVAAALNANFPPVFPNAAIDVDGVDRQDKPIPATRYWVTDGGAVDNRGIEMMLFALRAALKNLADNPLPRIHLIIADASALSDHFEQDRGLSSASGAGSHFASHLDAELVQVIKELYPRDSDRFTYSYLMMPDVLRTSGSFGTHWMLQPTVRVKQPLPPGDLDHSHDLASVTLSGEETVELIRAMHATKTKTAKTNPQALSADACKVMGWAEGDAGHGEGWKALLTALQASAETSKCAPRR